MKTYIKKLLTIVFLLLIECNVIAQPNYGLQMPSPDDIRQIPLLAGAGGGDFPLTDTLSKDLSRYMPPVLDQGKQASCVGWCLAYYLRSYQHAMYRQYIFLNPDNTLNTSRVFSPAFLYNTYKYKFGEHQCSSGMPFINAIKIILDGGYASLHDEPYNGASDPCPTQPGTHSYAKAYANVSFFRLPIEVNNVRKRLNEGTPVIMGLLMDNNFPNLKRNNTVYNYSGHPTDYHAVLCVGFDDSKKMFKFINSMGSTWGDKGYFYMPYSNLNTAVEECYISIPQYGPVNTFIQKGGPKVPLARYTIRNLKPYQYEIINDDTIAFVQYDEARNVSYFNMLDKNGNTDKVIPVFDGESTRVNIDNDLSYIFSIQDANTDSAQVRIEKANTSQDSDIDRIILERERLLSEINNNTSLTPEMKARKIHKLNL